MQGLVISFEGSTAADPAAGEAGARDCAWNFNMGRGSITYTLANGTKQELTQGAVNGAMAKNQKALSPADKAKFDAIMKKGHCRNWTAEEVKFVTETVAPTNLSGWKLKWRCQESEPDSGISVETVSTPGDVKFKAFKLDFSIDVTCTCKGKSDTAELKALLGAP